MRSHENIATQAANVIRAASMPPSLIRPTPVGLVLMRIVGSVTQWQHVWPDQ